MVVLEPGQVFVLWCQFCNPPKLKFYVLASIVPHVYFFLINSSPTSFQAARAHLMAGLHPIGAQDYPFLDQSQPTSYIDCTKVVSGYSAPQLEVLEVGRTPGFRVRLNDTDRNAVRAIVSASKLLTRLQVSVIENNWA